MGEAYGDDKSDDLGISGVTDGEVDDSEAFLLEKSAWAGPSPSSKKPNDDKLLTPARTSPPDQASVQPYSSCWHRLTPYYALVTLGALYLGARSYIHSQHNSSPPDAIMNISFNSSSLRSKSSFYTQVLDPNKNIHPPVKVIETSRVPEVPSSSYHNLSLTPTSKAADMPPFPSSALSNSTKILLRDGRNASDTQPKSMSSSSSMPSVPPGASPSNFISSSTSHASIISPSGSEPTHDLAQTPLHIQAYSADYGAIAEETLQLYGWDMIIEAKRPTTLRVLNPLHTLDSSPLSSPPTRRTSSSRYHDFEDMTYDFEVQEEGGNVVFSRRGVGRLVHDVTCTQAGSTLTVQVTERPSLRSYRTFSAVCKEVRREMRTLTRDDRQTYLESLDIFYRIPLADGRARYGPRFANNALLTAAHSSEIWCLHDPNQFMAVHSAFMHWAEQNMKRISAVESGEKSEADGKRQPVVLNETAPLRSVGKKSAHVPHLALGAIPYWDFHIDTQTLGSTWWWGNPFFQADDKEGFGPIGTSPTTGHVVEGSSRFARMPMVRAEDLPEDVMRAYEPGVDAYGFVTSKSFTLNSSPFVTRSETVCGLPMALPMAPAQNLFDCYDSFNTWKEATSCLYMQVHLQLHSHFGGGAWNCGVNLKEFQKSFPQYSSELLSFLGVSGRAQGLRGFRECDREAGRCHCPGLDSENMPYYKLYRLLASDLRQVRRAWPGEFFLAPYRGTEELRFLKNDGNFHDWEDQDRLLRMVARLWCETAVNGHFVSMASINDPVFYAAHVYFDRLSHFLALSPALMERGFNRTWSEAEGGGEGLQEKGEVKHRQREADDADWERDFEGRGEIEDDVMARNRQVRHRRGRLRRRVEAGDRETSSARGATQQVEQRDIPKDWDFPKESIASDGEMRECLGGRYTDPSPFTPYLMAAAGEEEGERVANEQDLDPGRHYSMKEIDELMHPLHPSLPYVYDDLVHWGGKRWDPSRTE